MALHEILTAEAYERIGYFEREHYAQGEDGNFYLQVLRPDEPTDEERAQAVATAAHRDALAADRAAQEAERQRLERQQIEDASPARRMSRGHREAQAEREAEAAKLGVRVHELDRAKRDALPNVRLSAEEQKLSPGARIRLFNRRQAEAVRAQSAR